MKNTVLIKSTSNISAIVSDIVLRENSNFKLVFRPLIIENDKQSEACVKGWFIYQRKNSDGGWEDFVNPDLYGSKLKSGEGLKLELKSEEVLKLLSNISNLKKIYEKYGILSGEQEFLITNKNIKSVLKQVSTFDNLEKIKALSQLSQKDLTNLTQNISQTKLQKLLDDWNDNCDSKKDDEKYWQGLFKNNSWVLSQIFSHPYILIDGEYYYGGKRGNNKGGVYGDFFYENGLTNNVAFIEIKTPNTPLVKGLYRGENDLDDNTVYMISEEVTGAINQLQNQSVIYYEKKDSLEEKRNIHNIKKILIVGNIQGLRKGQIKSLELFRNSFSNIELITFDELKKRIELLTKIYQS